MKHLASLTGVVFCLMALLTGPAAAHEVRPVFADFLETGPGLYEVTWRVPVSNGAALPVGLRFPADCAAREGHARESGGAAVTRISLRCPQGLVGSKIVLDGLSHTMVDGLVRMQFASGEVATKLVHPADPVFVAPAASGPLGVLRIYVSLGITHILNGYDHLLFVLALVLFVRSPRRLLTSATAFTVAHSITLSFAALGVIRVPPPPIEALIAVSILLLAVELVRTVDDPSRASGFRPPGLAFTFGLLHGLGFASALAKIGLPQREIPLALFGFNVGVEIGQVAFIFVLLGIGCLFRRLNRLSRRKASLAGAYVIGSLAAFWTIARIASF